VKSLGGNKERRYSINMDGKENWERRKGTISAKTVNAMIKKRPRVTNVLQP